MAACQEEKGRNFVVPGAVALGTTMMAAMITLQMTPALAQPVQVSKGDKTLGEYLSNTCTGCHQSSGKTQAGVPAIVGWPEDQFIAVMQSYKAKHRDNKVMQTIAAGLSAEDLAGLAAYYASIKPVKQKTK